MGLGVPGPPPRIERARDGRKRALGENPFVMTCAVVRGGAGQGEEEQQRESDQGGSVGAGGRAPRRVAQEKERPPQVGVQRARRRPSLRGHARRVLRAAAAVSAAPVRPPAAVSAGPPPSAAAGTRALAGVMPLCRVSDEEQKPTPRGLLVGCELRWSMRALRFICATLLFLRV
jgi:hypothetical protein